jgi:hypothetical protein
MCQRKNTRRLVAPRIARLPTRNQGDRELICKQGAPLETAAGAKHAQQITLDQLLVVMGIGGVASQVYDGWAQTTITGRQPHMKLDRAAQLKILRALEETFPMWRDTQRPDAFEMDSTTLDFQLAYLEQHGLVKCAWSQAFSAWRNCLHAEITAKGLDFIADDGGLTAILGTVTIKLDSGQWAELLASKVERLEGISHEERSSIASALRSLSAKAIEKVSEKMLDWAVDHAQDALPLLRTLLAQAVA